MQIGSGGSGRKIAHRDGEQKSHKGGGRENKLVLCHRRRSRFSKGDRGGAGLINRATANITATIRLHHRRLAAHRGHDCEGLGHDEQQAKKNGGESLHKPKLFFSFLDFLHVGVRALVELLFATLAAQFHFLAIVREDVGLAHLAAQLFAGDDAGIERISLGLRIGLTGIRHGNNCAAATCGFGARESSGDGRGQESGAQGQTGQFDNIFHVLDDFVGMYFSR